MEKKFLTAAALIVGLMVLIALWIGLRHHDDPPPDASTPEGSPPPRSITPVTSTPAASTPVASAPAASTPVASAPPSSLASPPGSSPASTALPLPDGDAPDAGNDASARADAGSDDASTPEGSAPPAAEGGAPRGTLSKETIRSAIGAMKPAVQSCYEQLLQEYPDAGGRIVLSFEVVGDDDGTGHIDLESVKPESELHEEDLHQCMLDALRQVDFPAPEGGTVRVTYPFLFSNAEPAPP